MFALAATETFRRELHKHRRNGELLKELDKKILRLRKTPNEVGGRLHGDLHGYRSTRLVKNFRLIFSIDEKKRRVTLEALDHRKDAYD